MDEFNRDTIRIYEHCVTPIFIMVMDMSPANYKEAESYKALLQRSAKKYSQFLLYTYANASNEFVKESKIAVEKVPGAVLTFRDGAVIPYPKEWVFDDSHMDKFFELYLRRRLNKSESDTSQPDYSKEIYQEMKAVKLLRSATFNSTVLQFGKYVLVFFFKSLEDDYAYFLLSATKY